MGFRQADSEGRGGFARIWEYHDVTNGATIKMANGEVKQLPPGNYSLVKLSTWKKRGEVYETDFQDGFVRLIGYAHTKAQELDFENMSFEKGFTIQITSCEVTTPYNAETKKGYTNYAIFAFNIPEGNDNSSTTKGGKKSSAKTSKTKTKKAAEVADEPEDELPF